MSEIIAPEKFCIDLLKDLVLVNPLDRRAIAAGYAKTLKAMLIAARKEGQNASN